MCSDDRAPRHPEARGRPEVVACGPRALGGCAVWLAPTVGLLVSSFRPARDVNATGWWTVLWHPVLTLANYAQVLASNNIGVSFLNSLIITIPATVIPVLVAAYAAYAFSWMAFPGRGIVYATVVALLLVPLQTTFVPVLRLLTAVGLTGTFPAVWLAHTGYGLPLAVYLLRNFIGGLPKDVIDAAAMDGASATSVFFRVVLPMSFPAVVSLTIFQFLWVWNDPRCADLSRRRSPRCAADGDDQQSRQLPGRRVGAPHRGRVRLDGPAAWGILRSAALFRARDPRRRGERADIGTAAASSATPGARRGTDSAGTSSFHSHQPRPHIHHEAHTCSCH